MNHSAVRVVRYVLTDNAADTNLKFTHNRLMK